MRANRLAKVGECAQTSAAYHPTRERRTLASSFVREDELREWDGEARDSCSEVRGVAALRASGSLAGTRPYAASQAEEIQELLVIQTITHHPLSPQALHSPNQPAAK
jgi:hypothetical protein